MTLGEPAKTHTPQGNRIEKDTKNSTLKTSSLTMPRSKNSTSTSHCPGKGRQGETSLERDDTSCTDDIVVSR